MNLINFRDIGGIKNKEGKLLKTQSLLRSGELVNISENDKNCLIQRYNLNEIIDLRNEKEIVRRPDDKIKGTKLVNIEVMKSAKTNGVSLDDLEKIGSTKFVDDHMFSVYHDLILNKEAQKGFGKFLDLLIMDDKGATLFHCFAGKDRTGIAAALVLWLLDVEEKLIIEDYLKTNESRRIANQLILNEYRAKGSKEESLKALEIALKVKKEYLERAHDLIKDNYGDVYTYADKALDFSKSKVEQLRNMYLN